MDILRPDGWKRPKGYSHAVKAHGEVIFVAGQIGWDKEQCMVSESIVDQTRQALENIVAILREAGAGPMHVARLTWYVTDIALYRSKTAEIGKAYRAVMGRNYPAMTLVQVADLLEKGALVEIEATAVMTIK